MTTRLEAATAKEKPNGPEIPPGNGSGGGRNGNGGGGYERLPSLGAFRMGMWLALASVTMLFIGLTSAYVMREGLDPNWRAIRLLPILLVNTAVLMASSLTLEKGRRVFWRKEAGCVDALRGWLAVTLLLGLTFLGGQLAAWRLLSAQGIYLGTNPHGSFVYLLTGLHGLHVAGGILALGYFVIALWLGRSFAIRASPGLAAGTLSEPHIERWIEVTAIYWHFMGGLWLYLLVLLFGVR